jgi:hypothetical protein
MRCRGYVASCLFAVALLNPAGRAQQPSTQPPAQSKSSGNARSAILDAGTISAEAYRNTSFGFTCKIPFGWVDRTNEMSQDSNGDSKATKQSILLLAVFEHPPEATGDSVNSAIVVAAEPTSSYPELQNAGQYFGPLTALTKSKGFRVVNEPYDFPVGATPLVRGDFAKPLGNLTMHQSTLVMLAKGYVLSFTFISGREDELDEIVEGLNFARKEARAAHK